MVPMTSKSQTITNPDWLHNAHAGEMLLSEFMEPLDLSVEQLATLIAVSPDRLVAVIDGERPVDGELDLRLGRYFGMSEGFFLRLQDQYELLEAKRALNGELERITPRAA
jgi:addiction module HigA family antidote